jgi:Protein of unknown function (DUF2752)
MNQEKIFNWGYLLFLIITPIICLLLPSTYFDNGESICPSKRFFNVECYGCGMTRAVMHLIHFEFDTAAYFNPLCFIVAPVLAFYWLKWTWTAFKKVQS